MYKTALKLIEEARRRRDWDTVFGLYWYLGLVTKPEAERLHFQKHTVITPEGNIYERKKKLHY